jgi:hypothetical protein
MNLSGRQATAACSLAIWLAVGGFAGGDLPGEATTASCVDVLEWAITLSVECRL